MSRMTRPFLQRVAHVAGPALLVTFLLISVGCETVGTLRRDAEHALEMGDYPRAERRVNEVLARDPSDWKALYFQGLIRNKQNRPVDAQLALEKAWSLRGEHEETSQILDALAESIFMQGDKAALHTFLDRAATRYGKPQDYLRQAQYLAKIGDYDAAKVAFQKAAHFWPKNDTKPYVAMADFYESIGDKDNTITALRRAYGINPNIPRINNRLKALGVPLGPTAALPPIE